MIEFRAECGHTIRARNEDAGKVVSCAYCGKKAMVPSEDESMDSLLADTLDESRDTLEGLESGEVAWGKGGSYWAPLRIVWTAVFLILVLSVLILTVRWVVQVVWTPEKEEPATTPATITTPSTPEPKPVSKPDEVEKPVPRPPEFKDALAGLDADKSGICVFSVPGGLELYVQELSHHADQDRLQVKDLQGKTHPYKRLTVELKPGRYRISVVATMSNSDLYAYSEYPAKVRRVARQGDPEATLLAVEDFFLQDGRFEWRLEKLYGQPCLVKSYEVELGLEWRPIYALFVPNISCSELLDYVGGERHFDFDERQAQVELEVYEVPENQRDAVRRALSRIGKAVVTDTTAGTVKVFEVRPNRSLVVDEFIGEQIPPEP